MSISQPQDHVGAGLAPPSWVALVLVLASVAQALLPVLLQFL